MDIATVCVLRESERRSNGTYSLWHQQGLGFPVHHDYWWPVNVHNRARDWTPDCVVAWVAYYNLIGHLRAKVLDRGSVDGGWWDPTSLYRVGTESRRVRRRGERERGRENVGGSAKGTVKQGVWEREWKTEGKSGIEREGVIASKLRLSIIRAGGFYHLPPSPLIDRGMRQGDGVSDCKSGKEKVLMWWLLL